MTEKDKMLAGKAYLGSEEQLVKERQYAKQVLFKFNNMNPVLVEERHNLLRELLGQTKENFYFEPPFRCDYGYNIEIGNNFYANYNLTILDCAKVKIGDNCVIGSGSVVTKDIPANSIAVGNPCRVLREITDEDKKYYYKNLRIEA